VSEGSFPEQGSPKTLLGGSCSSAHRRSGYSSPGCVPAEPDSTLPDDHEMLARSKMAIERNTLVDLQLLRCGRHWT
jgi:hypothetical protein